MDVLCQSRTAMFPRRSLQTLAHSCSRELASDPNITRAKRRKKTSLPLPWQDELQHKRTWTYFIINIVCIFSFLWRMRVLRAYTYYVQLAYWLYSHEEPCRPWSDRNDDSFVFAKISLPSKSPVNLSVLFFFFCSRRSLSLTRGATSADWNTRIRRANADTREATFIYDRRSRIRWFAWLSFSRRVGKFVTGFAKFGTRIFRQNGGKIEDYEFKNYFICNDRRNQFTQVGKECAVYTNNRSNKGVFRSKVKKKVQTESEFLTVQRCPLRFRTGTI